MARCSVFRANFSLSGGNSHQGDSSAMITQLINRSLLSNDEQRRVQIHEMVRQFAASKLAQNPTLEAATQQRYAEYFLGLLLQWWEGNESRHCGTVAARHEQYLCCLGLGLFHISSLSYSAAR